MLNLFVYGSLRHGFFNHHFLGLANASTFLKTARIRGANLYRRGRYPVMIFDGSLQDTVEGEIYVNVRPEVLGIIRDVENSSGFFEAENIIEEIACSLFVYSGPVYPRDLVRSGKWEDAHPVLKIAIPLFPGAHSSSLQACKEVLSSWSLGKEHLEIFSISDYGETYSQDKHFIFCQSHYSIADTPPIDILIIPEGFKKRAPADLISFVASCSSNVICALVFSSRDMYEARANSASTSGMETDPRETRSGIEGTFGLLAELYGAKAAQQHAGVLGYEWPPTEVGNRWIIYRGYGRMATPSLGGRRSLRLW